MKKWLRASIPWLLFCLAGFYLIGLYHFRTRVVTGAVNQRTELHDIIEANLLFDALPPTATQIEYWISPYNQYFEASFQIDKDEYLKWIDEIVDQGSTTNRLEQKSPVGKCVVELDPHAIHKNFPFLVHASEPSHQIHIKEGFLHDLIRTNQFRQFSAAFDVNQERAYFNFYK